MMYKIIRFFFCVSLILSTNVFANSMTNSTSPNKMSPWLIRLRAIIIDPDASSTPISLIGGNVTRISTQVVPELDFSYFFYKHFAAELVLATSRHKVAATRTALGTVPLGKVNVLPPTLTAQYHFFPNKQISPYFGAGVNFTYFYDVSSGPVATSVHYENVFGPAIQGGVDLHLNKHWVVNLDVKKVYIKPTVNVRTPTGAVLTTKVKINPLIYGFGIGYRP